MTAVSSTITMTAMSSAKTTLKVQSEQINLMVFMSELFTISCCQKGVTPLIYSALQYSPPFYILCSIGIDLLLCTLAALYKVSILHWICVLHFHCFYVEINSAIYRASITPCQKIYLWDVLICKLYPKNRIHHLQLWLHMPVTRVFVVMISKLNR